MQGTSGHVFWIFGLSGAGKSTVAEALAQDLRQRHLPVLTLDGDILRNGLCHGLGFSDTDRAENLRRAAEVARLGATSGLCVVASFITPLEAHRTLVRKIVGVEQLSLVWIDAPLEVCRQRDVKGLYAKAQAGQIQQMTGMGSAFEKPFLTNLVLSTAIDPPGVSAAILMDFAGRRLSTPLQE